MYNKILFNEIDEIDHFTIAIRKGADFNREKAVAFIKKYSSYYSFVENLEDCFNKNGEDFSNYSNDELYAFLIEIRDEMAKNVEIKGFEENKL